MGYCACDRHWVHAVFAAHRRDFPKFYSDNIFDYNQISGRFRIDHWNHINRSVHT